MIESPQNPEKDLSSDALPSIGMAAQYQQILDALTDMVLVKGPRSRLLWANRAFLKFYQMTNEELKGLVDSPFNDPDYTLQYVRDDAWVFEHGKLLDIPCEPVTRHDGTVHYFHTTKSPIFDSAGKVTMSVGLSRDITAERAAEMALLQSSKMASLGEMAGGVAHEINNPLAIIQGKAFNLLKAIETQPVDIPKIREFSQSIIATTERIAKIVRGLRSFARDGERDPVREESVLTLIADTLELCRERIRNHGIDLRLGEVDAGWRIECRATQIAQVLVNLLNNAHDAVLESEKPWISLSVRPVGDGYELRVSDSGKGIPENIRERMMEPFFTTKASGAGSGLGLSISRRIIEDHGGRLFCDTSCPNTTFVAFVPSRSGR